VLEENAYPIPSLALCVFVHVSWKRWPRRSRRNTLMLCSLLLLLAAAYLAKASVLALTTPRTFFQICSTSPSATSLLGRVPLKSVGTLPALGRGGEGLSMCFCLNMDMGQQDDL